MENKFAGIVQKYESNIDDIVIKIYSDTCDNNLKWHQTNNLCYFHPGQFTDCYTATYKERDREGYDENDDKRTFNSNSIFWKLEFYRFDFDKFQLLFLEGYGNKLIVDIDSVASRVLINLYYKILCQISDGMGTKVGELPKCVRVFSDILDFKFREK
jgi:hypothetical protein